MPSRKAPPPWRACSVSPLSGKRIAPTTGRRRCRTPIETAKKGRRLTKLIVPSIGSTIHSNSYSPCGSCPSSPRTACSGNARAHRLGQVSLHRLVGRGDRVGLRLILVLDLQRPAIARQDDLAGLGDELARRHLDCRQRRVVGKSSRGLAIVPAIGCGGRCSVLMEDLLQSGLRTED